LLYGANINAVNDYGDSALIYHSYLHHLAMVQFLIGAGADIHIIDSYGHTAKTAAQEELKERKEWNGPKVLCAEFEKIIDILEKAELINQNNLNGIFN